MEVKDASAYSYRHSSDALLRVGIGIGVCRGRRPENDRKESDHQKFFSEGILFHREWEIDPGQPDPVHSAGRLLQTKRVRPQGLVETHLACSSDSIRLPSLEDLVRIRVVAKRFVAPR